MIDAIVDNYATHKHPKAHALTGRDQKQFHRTAKGRHDNGRIRFSASPEAILGGLLAMGPTIVLVTNYDQIKANYLFAEALFVQSLPFLLAAALAALEGSRLDQLGYWQGLETRLSKVLSIVQQLFACLPRREPRITSPGAIGSDSQAVHDKAVLDTPH
jgi:hypothetical protein